MKKGKTFLGLLLAGALMVAPLAGCSAGAVGTPAAQTAQTGQTEQAADASFVFSDDGITASGAESGWSVEGTVLTISAAGTYTLSGSCAEGSVQVEKGVQGVRLVLNGLTLSGGGTAAILCGASSEVQIEAAAGSENSLSDSAENNVEESPENDAAENAVIKAKRGASLTLCGTGSLTIQANGKNGVKTAGEAEDGTQSVLTIRELKLAVSAPVNDAVNAGGTLLVQSGTLLIDAADDALHADGALTVGGEDTDGPEITIASCYEGLEAADLLIQSGTVSIRSEDDCMNAANSDLTGYSFTMTITGGTISAFSSSGDGFDSNGSLTVSGGDVRVFTASRADNEPLDADGTLSISGGTVLAVGGSSGMGIPLQAEQACVLFTAQNAASGAELSILDADGATLCTAEPELQAAFVLFSSPELEADAEYTLRLGETEVTATAASGAMQQGYGGGPGGFGGFGGGMPGGQDGERPELPDGATLPDGVTPPDGEMPQPGSDGNPPEKPDGEPPQGAPDAAQPEA